MKSLVPWFCLVAATGSPLVFANDGLLDYRKGEYFAAGKNLYQQSGRDPVADYYLGRMRLYGFGELKNNDFALRYFIKSAEKGFLPAQQLLARYYLMNVDNPELALKWFKKVAAAGDVNAQMYCAAAYLFGFGTRKYPDGARRYYIDAAKNGNKIAQYTLANHFIKSRDSRTRKLGLIWLNKSVEQDNPKAQLKLGTMYLTGSLVGRNTEKGEDLIRQAAKQNYVPAMMALGELAQKQGDLSKAGDWYERAARGNNTRAELALANMYLDEKGRLYDPVLGFRWMLRSAQHGNFDAQKKLAVLYKEGKVVDADENLANQWQAQAEKTLERRKSQNQASVKNQVARWLTNGKMDNFADSDYRLGGIYNAWQNPLALKENNYNQSPRMNVLTRTSLYKPRFQLINPDEVAISEYFDILAPMFHGNQSNDWSFKRYPINREIQVLENNELPVLRHEPWYSMMDEGRPYPEKNVSKLFDYLGAMTSGWEQQANYQAVLSKLYGHAILGESDSQYEIGQLYQYGIAVSKNPQQAIVYLELAASQQDIRAEYNLGILYLEGQTTPVDYQKGIEWMTDAAFKGNPYAQYALANIYEKGFRNPEGEMIVQPDHNQAMAMYYLAASNNFGEAQYRLADFLVKENNANLSVAARQNRMQLIKKLYEGAAKQGIAEAVLPLAFYNAMDNDPEKQKKAFKVAKQEAGADNPEAALLLGIMYERGLSVPENEVESLYWYQQAAMNPVTSFVLGTYYSEGRGVSKDVDKGLALLQQSADSGFSYANLNLAVLKQKAGEPFLGELEKARQKNNSKAGLLLADYYLQQADDPENMKQARDIYQHFAEKGDKDAQLKLAFLFDKGLGGEVNPQAAEHWYTLSAEQEQPVAQYLLGKLYQLGRIGGKPDYQQAKKWYSAAKQKYTPAAVALGFIFDTVDDDYLNATENYEQAAAKDSRIGQFNLGLIYEYGKGQPVNIKKAEALYLKAAEQGFAPAMSQLAGLYFNGKNGQRDEHKALTWYKKAAALGDRDANYQLGLLSETGVATKLDYADAVKYYQQSSDEGNAKAKLALARMYQYGLGVTKDVQHAADLYKQLAEYNNAYAQYQLALLYYEGALGEKTPEKGKKMLVMAKKNGSQQAQKMLQWIDAQQEMRSSFIEPVPLNNSPDIAGQPADLIYLNALNEWNRGDETLSRMILDRLMTQFPHYIPAKRAYEQLNQQTLPIIFS
ncbi:tetratricopeptide repeat protein [Legionella spiritensis]|uniref:Enhanced entry protein EnhC n=1 Tax=Legionella spiritensis TaxID=452 RepID=A0A0W0ZAR1_LEGSP|nr:SEL1-like repeat protein [Legionella spiritensis]KTD66121.1 enhanced entry protein EnhC [Legionella spiritensis]SNV44067.1 enhanced entry protein EnhC [Legionella spiritensis]